MPAAYSTDRHQRVIDGYKAKEESQRELAKRFKVSLSFVVRLISAYRSGGEISAKKHGGGMKALITQEDLVKVQQLVNEQPDA